MEIYVDGDKIVLTKYKPGCIFCDSVDNTVEFKNKFVCKECFGEIQEDDGGN